LVRERLFDLGEQVVAAEEKLDRVLQFVDQVPWVSCSSR
jgi:hypothetical protein